MAIFSFSAQYVQRSKGKSSVAMAAYRAGADLYEEHTGIRHDYTRKAVVHSEILAPERAPTWVYDRELLWNGVELRSNRSTRPKAAVLAREIRIALPRELNREEQCALMRAFLRDEFVSRGMIADWSLHDERGKNQPHVHVMLTTRTVGPDGLGNKCAAWDRTTMLFHWREQWAAYANRALESAGHEARIDHRSYVDQGIDLTPQPKLYRNPEEAEHDGRDNVQERGTSCQQVAQQNGARILAEPAIVLRLLTQQRATFRREDLLKALHTHTFDAPQFDACLRAVMASPELVVAGTDDKGVERFTSREMLETEQRLLQSADVLSERRGHQVHDALVTQALARADHRLRASMRSDAKAVPRVSDEQRRAIHHLTHESGAIALLEGKAGTGKSFLLGAARDAWQAQGLIVVGGALAGKATGGLEDASGIEARTLASWERAWAKGRDKLTRNHVFVIDEAGMLGTRQLERLIAHARAADAKVVLVGDSRQLQAIEAGSPFRALVERLGATELTEVLRQRVQWQKEASQAFGGGDAKVAVDAYHGHGLVVAHEATTDAREGVVRAWAADSELAALDQRLMLAYRRDDVRELNRLAREVRRNAGELGADHLVATADGQRSFAVGDRVLFGQNNWELGVKNGTLGTIQDVREGVLLVRADGDDSRQIVVDPRTYEHIDHGYAVTAHKSQGATVDRAYVLASSLFDASASYVALSRHRDHAELHWAREEFGTRRQLDYVLTRERPKELASELALEHDDARGGGSAALREMLQDDSRFALLPLDHQRSLIAALEEEVGERAAPLTDAVSEWRRLPEVLDTTARLEKADEHCRGLVAAHDERERSGRRPTNVGALDEELERARLALSAAMLELRRVNESTALREKAGDLAALRNAPVTAKRQSLQRWRESVLQLEREALLERAVLERQGTDREVRLSTPQDLDRQVEVLGSRALGSLSTGQTFGGAFVRTASGERLLVELPLAVRPPKRGERLRVRDFADRECIEHRTAQVSSKEKLNMSDLTSLEEAHEAEPDLRIVEHARRALARATTSERTVDGASTATPPREQLAPHSRTRVLPHDADAERALLSGVVLQTGALEQVAPVVRAQDFYSEANARIFEVAAELHRTGVPLDAITVREALAKSGALPLVGGDEYLHSITDAMPLDLQAHGHAVRSASELRATISACQAIVEQGHNDYGSSDKFIGEAQARLLAAAEPAAPSRQLDARSRANEAPPHSLDAERAVLAGLILDNKSFERVADVLRTGDFYSEANARIYDAALQLHGAGERVDTATLSTALTASGMAKSAGGDEYLLSLTDQVPVVANIRAHAEIVRERSDVRRTIAVCRHVAAHAYEQPDARDLLTRARASLESIQKDRRSALDRVGVALEETNRTQKESLAQETGTPKAPTKKADEIQRASSKSRAKARSSAKLPPQPKDRKAQRKAEHAQIRREHDAARSAAFLGAPPAARDAMLASDPSLQAAVEREGRQQLAGALNDHVAPEIPHDLQDATRTSSTPAPAVEQTQDDIGDRPDVKLDTEPRLDAPPSSPPQGVSAHRRREVLGKSASRIAALAAEAKAARERDGAAYKARGLPELPKDSPRRQALHKACTPEQKVTEAGRPRSLQPLDQNMRQIQRDVVDNALWIAADYLDRTTTLERADDRIGQDPVVAKLEERYRKAEERVRNAAQALDDYAPRTGWSKAVETFRGGPGDDQRLAKLHAEMKEASLAIHDVKRELDEVRSEAREHVEALNQEALEIQREAQQRRDEIEQPLRDALMERHLAELALANLRVPQHLRAAQEKGPLTYLGVRTIGAFDFHEFDTTGATFLADATELRALTEKLALTPGDRVTLRENEHGARRMHVQERSDAWPRSREIEGVVVEIAKSGDQVQAIKLHDRVSGCAKWVRPVNGDDLSKEFPNAVLQRIEHNDVLRIGPSAINITPGFKREHDSDLRQGR